VPLQDKALLGRVARYVHARHIEKCYSENVNLEAALLAIDWVSLELEKLVGCDARATVSTTFPRRARSGSYLLNSLTLVGWRNAKDCHQSSRK
jgi:hypothetical protein